jgi:hypothetical protein
MLQKSLAELFLEQAPSLRERMLVTATRSKIDTETPFETIKRSYCSSDGATDVERSFASIACSAAAAVIDEGMAALVESQKSHDERLASLEKPPLPISLSTVILTLGAISAVAIVVDAKSLAIVLALLTGLAGFGAASGSLHSMLSRLPYGLFRSTTKLSIPDRREADERQVSKMLSRAEGILRQADTGIIAAKNALDDAQRFQLATTPIGGGANIEVSASLLQDLYEIGRRGSGEAAIALARERVPTVARSLGMILVEADDVSLDHFTIDGPENGQLITLRPAVLLGDRRLALGYARRR